MFPKNTSNKNTKKSIPRIKKYGFTKGVAMKFIKCLINVISAFSKKLLFPAVIASSKKKIHPNCESVPKQLAL